MAVAPSIMDDRRRFLTGLGLLLAWPGIAHAQPTGNIPRVGYLFYGSPGPSREIDAFRQGLLELGYIEGQSIAVEYRFASGQVEQYSGLAAELVRLKVDVIVAPATPQALAAKQATRSIPIVFVLVADAVGAGLITNFARPGGNITGLTSSSADLGGKRLELLKQMVPKASRVAVLYNPTDRSNVLILKQLQESVATLGLILQPLQVREPRDFDGAFVAMARQRAHAMFGSPGALTFEHRKVVVDLAAKHRIPAMWGHRSFVDAGGLMSYAVNLYDQNRQAAVFVDKILKGAKPGDLPVEQPTKFELVINFRSAKALGLTIPRSLLVQADQVIE
jgi:putative tryptophan/tyrosine transport system substrate-binding protein